MAGFSKPLLAGVTGSCVGLGVGLLPLCDLVYVSEKATLQTFYSRLGTVPEGGATHSLTVLLGHMKVRDWVYGEHPSCMCGVAG